MAAILALLWHAHSVRATHQPARHPAPSRLAGVSDRANSRVANLVGRLRVISYYPAWHPWGATWEVWQPSVLDADMAKIASLDASTVRVFVQPAAFGYPVPHPAYIARLREMVSIAASHGLKVWINLFDGWFNYGDLSGSREWAAAVLAPFRDDPRIAAIELQNEIDPTNPRAMTWAQQMLRVIRADSGRPVTVSVTGWNTAAPLARLIADLGSSQPDFYDLHFYGTPPYMLPTFETAKRLAGAKPLLIGETGYSTAPSNTSWLGSAAPVKVQERAQARYFFEVELAARAAGLPPVGVWNLNDFPVLLHISAVERNFGLYRPNGTAKPATTVIRSAFAG